ncbi:MAG: FYVE zinc finger domain-containing protein [Candidatus Hodarchaeales archaeon]
MALLQITKQISKSQLISSLTDLLLNPKIDNTEAKFILNYIKQYFQISFRNGNNPIILLARILAESDILPLTNDIIPQTYFNNVIRQLGNEETAKETLLLLLQYPYRSIVAFESVLLIVKGIYQSFPHLTNSFSFIPLFDILLHQIDNKKQLEEFISISKEIFKEELIKECILFLNYIQETSETLFFNNKTNISEIILPLIFKIFLLDNIPPIIELMVNYIWNDCISTENISVHDLTIQKLLNHLNNYSPPEIVVLLAQFLNRGYIKLQHLQLILIPIVSKIEFFRLTGIFNFINKHLNRNHNLEFFVQFVKNVIPQAQLFKNHRKSAAYQAFIYLLNNPFILTQDEMLKVRLELIWDESNQRYNNNGLCELIDIFVNQPVLITQIPSNIQNMTYNQIYPIQQLLSEIIFNPCEKIPRRAYSPIFECLVSIYVNLDVKLRPDSLNVYKTEFLTQKDNFTNDIAQKQKERAFTFWMSLLEFEENELLQKRILTVFRNILPQFTISAEILRRFLALYVRTPIQSLPVRLVKNLFLIWFDKNNKTDIKADFLWFCLGYIQNHTLKTFLQDLLVTLPIPRVHVRENRQEESSEVVHKESKISSKFERDLRTFSQIKTRCFACRRNISNSEYQCRICHNMFCSACYLPNIENNKRICFGSIMTKEIHFFN